jgi:hypothetical protein
MIHNRSQEDKPTLTTIGTSQKNLHVNGQMNIRRQSVGSMKQAR